MWSVNMCWHGARRLLFREGESGVAPSQHHPPWSPLGLLSAPPPSLRVVTRGKETHSRSLASL